MRLHFILLFLATIFSPISGQSDHSSIWSDKYEDNGSYSLVATKDGSIYATRSHRSKLFVSDSQMELIKYDSDLNIEYTVSMDDLEEDDYLNLGTIQTTEGIMQLYYQSFKNGKTVVSGQLFDYNDLHKTDILDLAKFKDKSSSNQRVSDLSILEFLDPVDFRLSLDKSKLALLSYQERIGKRKETYYQYKVIDLSTGFSTLHEGDFYSDARSDKYEIKDIDVANNGDLNYLLKSYTENIRTEFVNRKPAYAYEVHHLTGDSTEYIYDIKVQKEFIDDLKIAGGNNGEVYAAGYIRKKPFSKINSAYFLALDPSGNVVSDEKSKYRPRDIKDIVGKKKDELYSEFKILNVLNGDNMVFVVKQYIERKSSTINNPPGSFNRRFNNNNLDRFNISWNLDEVVIEGYNKNTFERSWITTNRRDQHENEEFVREFITASYHLVGDNLYIIYNERPVNIDRLRKNEKLKRSDVPGDTTEPTIAKINVDGDLEYKTLPGEKRFYIGKTGVLLDMERLYLLSSRSNYSQYKIGKINISILH